MKSINGLRRKEGICFRNADFQYFQLPYRRFGIGITWLASGSPQVKIVKNLRYSATRQSRNETERGCVGRTFRRLWDHKPIHYLP
jgi:hypothetical protein